MANTIKIKRSTSTATPTSLSEGELAYSESSSNLFIGTSGDNVANIGGIIGTTVQGYDANIVSDANYVATANNFTNADHTKLDGIATGANNYALTDDLASGEITQLQNIGASTITATQWGYLGASDGAITNTDTQLSTEQVQDIVGAMFGSNTETRITATYVDGAEGAGKINLVVDDMSTNTFRTVTAGGNTLGGSEALDFVAGSNVTITESGGDVTITATDTNTIYSSSDFTHDSLSGVTANEHIDWTGSSAGTIHSSNYTDTTYSVGDGGLTQNNLTDALKSNYDSAYSWYNTMTTSDGDSVIDTVNEIVSAFENHAEGLNLITELDSKLSSSSNIDGGSF